MINAEASRAASVASRTLAAYATGKPKEVSPRAEETSLQPTSPSPPSADKQTIALKPEENSREKASNDKGKDPEYDPLIEQRSGNVD